MNRGEIYLSVDDMMKLMGSYSRGSAYRKHLEIRRRIAVGKKNLTVKEYCEVMGEDFKVVWGFLRKIDIGI